MFCDAALESNWLSRATSAAVNPLTRPLSATPMYKSPPALLASAINSAANASALVMSLLNWCWLSSPRASICSSSASLMPIPLCFLNHKRLLFV